MVKDMTVTISYAQSLDGRIATQAGESQWISGPGTLKLAHRLRRDADAIIVGIGTVLKDDPLLTCRLPRCSSPFRVILDSRLRMPPGSQIALTARTTPSAVFTSPKAMDDPALLEKAEKLRSLGIEICPVDTERQDRVSIAVLLEELACRGFRNILVEGGKGVITSFLRSGRVNRMLIVTAPLIIGRGVEAVGDIGVRELAQALKPTRFRTRRRGKDLIWEIAFG